MKKPSDFIYGIIVTVIGGLLLIFLSKALSPERKLTYDIKVIEQSKKGLYLSIVLHNKGSSTEDNIVFKLSKRAIIDYVESTFKVAQVDGSSDELPKLEIMPTKDKFYYESTSETISVKAVDGFYVINFGKLRPKQEETLKGFFVGAYLYEHGMLLEELNIKSSNTKAEISYFSYIRIFYPLGFWVFVIFLFLIIAAGIYELNFRPYENRLKDAQKAYEDLLDKKDIKGNEKHNI